MNQRAFNLFTALVAFVMILLTVIITNSMTQTEEKAIATVSDLEAQSEMQAVADLARGDALQVFVYNLRYKMETWLTKPDNWFPIFPDLPGETPETSWKKVQQGYITANFGSECEKIPGTNDCKLDDGRPIIKGQQFAFEATKQISGILAVGSSFGRYTIDLKQDDAAMLEALKSTVSTSVGREDFFTLVDCDTANNCSTGTFYVNLDLGKGAFNSGCNPVTDPTNETPACQNDERIYESLPKIIVKKVGTRDTLEMGILPRGKIRIYVPLRIFKAAASAKKIAENQIFTDGLRNELKDLRLGMCDSDCTVRQNNLEPPGETWSHACPSTPIPPGDNETADIAVAIAGVNYPDNYYPNAQTALLEMRTKLTEILNAVICTDPNSVLQSSGEDPFGNGVSCRITGEAIDTQHTKNITTANPDIGGSTSAFCARVSGLQILAEYRESDDRYRVNKHNDAPYQIRIDDSAWYFEPDPSPGNCTTNCGLGGGNCSCS